MSIAGGWWHVGRRCSRLVWPWGGHLGAVCLLVVAGTAAAQFFLPEVRVTETLPPGQVNWTDGVVLSRDRATGSTRRGAGVVLALLLAIPAVAREQLEHVLVVYFAPRSKPFEWR